MPERLRNNEERSARLIKIEQRQNERLEKWKFLPSQQWSVILGEKCDRFSRASSASRSSNAMDIGYGRWRKIVVDHQIHALEVDSSSHQFGADQHPDFALAEAFHYIVSLQINQKI